jgi:hypothetical protein
MKDIVSGQRVVSRQEFAELALGIDTELFIGPADGETATERAARLDAASDILAELWRTDPELAAYASRLMAPGSVLPLLGGHLRTGNGRAASAPKQVAA